MAVTPDARMSRLVSGLVRELGREHPLQVVVTGTSMTPFLRSGDVVTVAPVAFAAVRLGDVVAVEEHGRLCVHRVVCRSAEHLVTRGDAAARRDPPAPAEALRGRVVRAAREGREVRLGLGPERWLLALASDSGVLGLVLSLYERLRRPAHGTP